MIAMLIGALVLALEAAPGYSVEWPADAACTAGDLEWRIDEHLGTPIEGRERVEVRAPTHSRSGVASSTRTNALSTLSKRSSR